MPGGGLPVNLVVRDRDGFADPIRRTPGLPLESLGDCPNRDVGRLVAGLLHQPVVLDDVVGRLHHDRAGGVEARSAGTPGVVRMERPTSSLLTR